MNTLTIGQFFQSVSPKLWADLNSDSPQFPKWPPDAFGLTTSLLLQSGAFVEVLSESWPPEQQSTPKKTSADDKALWCDTIKGIGAEWRAMLSPDTLLMNSSVPSEVRNWWSLLIREKDVRISELGEGRVTTPRVITQIRHALLQIAAAADESCFGAGFTPDAQSDDPLTDIPLMNGVSNKLSRLKSILLGVLAEDLDDVTSTLCVHIDSSQFRVLPKMRTPQNGLTIRNLSHNLSLIRTSEVIPNWNLLYNKRNANKTAFNLMLVPWPDEVKPANFDNNRFHSTRHPGRFAYSAPKNITKLLKHFKDIFTNAIETCSEIDGVIFPELSLLRSEYEAVLKELKTLCIKKRLRTPFLIAGILGEKKATPTNYVVSTFPSSNEDESADIQLTQHKHHRWCLDRGQITRYGLASRLDPNQIWWEAFIVKERTLKLAAYSSNLLLSVLICEDLARPEPVADIIRAIGPNLVIALLMDGPQLKTRWSARYAAVLADDPGASVLTLTSLGMINLSRRWEDASSPRKIALWCDSHSGMCELELPPNAHALVLNISTKTSCDEPERTADGRTDKHPSTLLTLNGVHPISATSGKSPPRGGTG